MDTGAREWVLVIERCYLFSETDKQSFHGIAKPSIIPNLDKIIKENAEFVPREDAEQNPNWKQPILYNIMVKLDETGKIKEVFSYKRTTTGQDPRLYNNHSLGVGGHVNPIDGPDPASALVRSQDRELSEEVSCTYDKPQLIGLLNDDSNQVGRVHIGLVYIVPIRDMVTVKEQDKMKDAKFMSLEELSKIRDSMETWSQLVLDHILTSNITYEAKK